MQFINKEKVILKLKTTKSFIKQNENFRKLLAHK